MTAELVDPPFAASPVLIPVEPSVPDDELSVEQLGSRIVGLAGRLAAATCQWLLLVARFDERVGYDRFGLASTARWLTHCCGLSHRAAVDHVRVARTLAAFPVLAGAMSAGRLSYSHVRAIARVAKPGADVTVTDLVELAEAGTVGQLETVVRGLRTVERADGSTGDDPAEYVRTGWSSSSSHWRLGARLAPERGGVVQKALEAVCAAEDLSAPEALERIAEIALVVLDGAGQAPTLRGDERAAVIVHLDLATARSVCPTSGDGAQVDSDRAVGTDPGAGLAVEAGPDTSVTDPAAPPVHHPGCHSRAGLEAHHVRHWLWGGRTDLANLVLLCRRHHHAHHHDEFAIGIRADGSFVFRRPDGRVLEDHVDPARLIPAAPPLPPVQVRPQWVGSGGRLDRHYAVSVLAQRRERADRPAA